MKRLFLPLAMLFFGACASAQVPSFKSFNPTQFSTNNFIISITNSALVTNVNNIETLFINSTNIFNLFAPASAGTTSYWTNILGTLQPTAGNIVLVTNLVSEFTMKSPGAFVLPSSISSNLVAGANCIDVTYSSSVDFNGPTTTPSDATVELTLGNTQGSILVLHNSSTNAFSMINGTPTCDGTPGAYVRLNGDWSTTNSGDGLVLYFTGLIWTEIGRFQGGTNVISGDNVWENVSGNIRPVNGNANNVLSFTSGLANNATNVAMVVNTTNLWSATGSLLAKYQNAGTNNTTITRSGRVNVERGPDSGFSNDYGFTTLRKDSDGFNFAGIASRYEDSGSSFSLDLLQDNTGSWADFATDNQDNAFVGSFLGSGGYISLTVGADVRTELYPGVASSGSAVAYTFDTSNTLTNGDKFVSVRNAGTEVLNISPNSTGAQIVFGPGTTNVLYRSGNNLSYTNSATAAEVDFSVINGSGNRIHMGIGTGGTPFVESLTGTLYMMTSGGNGDVALNSGGLSPITDNVLSLGSGAQWVDLFLSRNIIWNSTATNSLKDTWGSSGSPEGVLSAFPSSIYRDALNGAAYLKAAGTGNTGWQKIATTGTGSTVQAEYLDADETNDTVTPDNLALSATVSAAGEYAFTLTVFLDNSTDADGAVVDFNGGDATMTSFRAQAKAFDSALVLSTQTTTLDGDISVATLTGAGSIEVSGGFTVNAAGTFIPRFFMEADSGGTLTAFRNSTLIVTAAQ